MALRDHGRRGGGEVEAGVAVVGVAIVPADQFGRGVAAGEALTGDAQGAVGAGAEGVDHGVVVRPQLRGRHVTPELDVADEVERRMARDAVEHPRHRLDLGVVGCHAATHQSLRDLYEVSVPELDCLAQTAREVPGVLGARLTGAGFGGCVVVILSRSARDGLRGHLEREFERRFGRKPGVFFFRGDGGPREVI